MLGHGDAIFFTDGNGHAKEPPHNVTVDPGTPNAGKVDEVENPNPAAGTNNWYSEDGYGGGSFGSPSFGGGSYSNCADPTQNGVSAVVKYLQSLPHPVDPHCEVGHYYLLNNYNPGYFGQGENAFTDESPDNTVFTIPPSATRSIGDELLAKDISWKYYGDQWNDYAGVGNPNQPLCNPPALVKNCFIPEDKYQINYGAAGSANPLGQNITNADEYCNICNPFQYDTSIMANPAVRAAHIQDTLNLYADIADGKLPAVSFVKPSGFVDGHPSSSKLNLFEGFVQKIVTAVQANKDLWKDTAIIITFDEGGGYYDSGYVQPLDFFGDGTRIPCLVVSKFSEGGKVTHNYSDHVSILKFIERNWSLRPVTFRSRDNYPNPITEGKNVYVPVNGPAISDLFELFDFK
jgi:phospholipase C